MCAPAPERAWAIAKPSPRDEPVTSATRPFSENISSIVLRVSLWSPFPLSVCCKLPPRCPTLSNLAPEAHMRGNPLCSKLQNDEPVFGPLILELVSPGLPQIFAAAGADFIMYDQEAGCLDDATIKTQIALTRGLSIVPMVNTAWHNYHLLARPLDCGAMGLLVPVVQTRAEAEAIAQITHYPPNGVRGAAFGIAHDDYAGTNLDEAIKVADERTLIAVKIETAMGVENIEEIISV